MIDDNPPPYYSETQKIRPTMKPWLEGLGKQRLVLDFGCGNDRITPDARGIDINLSADIRIKKPDDVYTVLEKNSWNGVDAIFSSHFLEHISHPDKMIKAWYDCLKPGGYLMIYLPDDDYYDNDSNPEHLHKWVYRKYTADFRKKWDGKFKVVDSGPDVGFDRYSFYLVAEKRNGIPKNGMP